MHKFFVWLLALGTLAGSAAALDAREVSPSKGVVRVKLQAEMAGQVGNAPRRVASGTLSTGVSTLDRASDRIKAKGIRPMLPYNPRFAEQRAKYGLDRWYVIDFDENVSVDQARKILAGTPGVELSETVVPMVLKEGNGDFVTTTRPPMKATAADYMFNDPQLPSQWHYRNFGNTGTTVEGADINLFEAWKTETGKSDVLVAIIDGGVDYKHEDLAANMYVNLAELNGKPGVDDDGNGYVDDIYGYNFCTNSGEVYPHSHGTHVAGTVAAVNNNGIGVAGVAGGDGTPGSGARMISCQVFDSRAGAADGDFAAAIVYAAEMGATIAQCSWGWDAPEYYEQAVLDAIDYFTETARSDRMTGGLCIFAAGNMGATGNYYPAAYEKVVAVAAMTNELAPASYSNYGEWVDVIAPGGLLDYGEAGGVLSTLPNNEYGFNEGTSMATPHVSGIAALILSKHGSKSFVNESLRTQLTTSVNDFYGFRNNSQYEGLYGSGFIDAAKALTMGDGSAPEAVADFSLDAAQDYIALEWTIPSSNDNNVHHHIIYYSESPFTAATDPGTLSSAVADTKFLSSGEKARHEITGLRPMTTYHVAITAVNRWGKPSAMSAVKSITTNAGPKMTVDATSLSLESTASAPKASATFAIGNEADGILKWQASKRTASFKPSIASRPSVGRVVPFAGKTGGVSVRPFSAVTGEYDSADYPVDMAYFEQIWAYIGDTDRSKPNSMAQWFRVDPDKYPDGFNLTDIKIDGMNGTNPRIEIYKGDVAISSASLLQKIQYPYFAYSYPIALNEQLHFSPGESFWIAVHFDGGQEGYPLCMAKANAGGMAAYSFMSIDGGKSWSQLSAALKGSTYEAVAEDMTWAITARSSNPDWSEVLEIAPASGTIRKGESQSVTVSADGSRMINGTYNLNLHLTSNQTENADVTVPVSYAVSGNPHDIITPKVVNFGSLLVGQSKTMTVEVYNRGYGNFTGSAWGAGIYSDKISSTSPNFAGPDYVQSGFPARTKVSFDLTYTPTESGSHTGNIVFTDKDGKTVRIVVQGVATDPAKLTLDPAVVEGGVLNVGDEAIQKSFRISNAGKYPLEFVFPRFSSETIEGQTASYHKHGYTVASTLEGYNEFAYDGNPALIGGTDISSQFSDSEHLSSAVSLGFAFPFYGKTYEKAYITSFGGITFKPNELTFRAPLTEKSQSLAGIGMIAAYGRQLLVSPDTRIEYAKADGKFVVKYSNVLALVYDNDYIPVSFHIALSSNGDIEIFYDDYNPDVVFTQGSGLFCAIVNPDMDDSVVLTSADRADIYGFEEPTAENQRFRSFRSGTAVKFEAPKPLFVKSLNVPYGIINPGESVEITATLAADASMNAGPTFNNIAIATNDPAPEYSYVKFNAEIDGAELAAEAALEESKLTFGKAFRTSTVNVPVTVKNVGKREMTITEATLEKGKMSTATELPVVLAAGVAKDIIVSVPTDTEGEITDALIVKTTAGDLRAEISGTVIGCPELGLSFNSVEETVESRTPLHKDLVVSNNGNETLLYSITPAPGVRLSLPENAASTTSYQYSFSGDDSNVKFEWVDIETNGLGEQRGMTYYLSHDFVAVDLPFEFPFYGKKYSKMYVYNSGFVSFTERRDDKLWPQPPAEFPAGTLFTNIIAPYWGMHSMDQTKTSGTFHYVTEDRAVVSFIEYGNSMNIGVDFQVILEKDGSFKFQYKGAFDEAVIFGIFGLAGICNTDGSSSIRLPERMVAFDRAVSFSPVVESPVAPGSSETIGLDFDTNRMAGVYEQTLAISSNVPGSEKVSLPVSLTITGKSEPVWPADITVENVAGYQSTDYTNEMVMIGAMYDAPLTVSNNGTACFEITDVQVDGPTIIDEFFGDEMPAFSLFVRADELDYITGEPTGRKIWQQFESGWMTVSVGAEPVQFSVPMMPSEIAYTIGEVNVGLTFTYMTEEGEKQHKTNVRFNITPAPAISLDREEIRVKASSETDTFTETLKLGNEGEYKLNYTLSLDPTGVGEEIEEGGGGGIAPWAASLKAASASVPETCRVIAKAKALDTKADKSALDEPDNFDYRNAMFYPALPGTQAVYNYGPNSLYDMFKAATWYKAPDEGFNVSHIYTPVSIETATNVDIRVEIIAGSSPAEGGAVLGKGKLHIASQANPATGQYFTIPLDKSVYLNPGEEFCVVITYPAGIKLPAYLVAKEEAVVTGRYLAWTQEAGWYDVGELFNDQYGSLGYIMTCLETVEGQPWIKLLDTATEGTVEAGSSTDVKFAINAAAARLEKDNKAVLVIKGNDPNAPLINFPIVLDKNGTPVIVAPEGIVYTKEGTKTTVDVTVTEPDGDNFTIEFADASGNARITAVDAGNGTATAGEDGTYKVSGTKEPVAVSVEIAPDYGSAAAGNAFNITVTDDKGLYADAAVRYDIEHVNRAPVAATDIAPVVIAKGSMSEIIALSSLISDPDNDRLEYTVTMPHYRFAEAYTTADGVIFYGKTAGKVTATVTATDPSGLTATVEVPVEVTRKSGLTDAEAAAGIVKVTPNPVDGDINVFCGFEADDALFTLYDAAGKVISANNAPVAAGAPVVIPADALARGIYILTVTTDDRTYTVRIIKP